MIDLKKYFLLLMMLMILGCGEIITEPPPENKNPTLTTEPTETISNTPTEAEPSETETSTETNNSNNISLSGMVTYDLVPFKRGVSRGLDYDNILKKPVRGAVVEIVDAQGKVVATTTTDENGKYALSEVKGEVKVRVVAQLYKAVHRGESSWNFQVKDNTNSNAIYVMEGSLKSLGSSGRQTRNLNAPSGWNGNAYGSKRVAGPFAILDVIYKAIQKVQTAQSDAVFPPLNIFWSKDNISASGNISLGQIITSHYDGTSLYILGAENSDTDEYDSAIIGHEWGHYYESVFSRSDSIGGSHSNEDMLDIRLAFGEGFGTAMGCIIIDSPLYIDSLGNQQGRSFGDDLEAITPLGDNPGWFNEASIYRVLYDIYDSNSDTGDTLSFGFTPIHKALINGQKNTPAFTSIFSFITALKAENPGNDEAIDAITSRERIAPITDIYGTGRSNRVENASPLYSDLSVGSSVEIVTNYSARATSNENKLGRYNFIKFTIPTSGLYTISINAVGNRGSDPDFAIYKAGSNEEVASAQAPTKDIDSVRTNLSAGSYRMAVIVYNTSSGNKFQISLSN